MFDAYNTKIKLKDIPLEFISPNNEKFKLIGLVDYEELNKRKSIGHFTAVVYHIGHWTRYNDMTAHSTLLHETHEVQPQIIFYTKYIQ